MDNMKLYEQARSVPDEALKPITAGRLKGMNDINPMWRFKRLTEMFGPCGVGWWYEVTEKHIVYDEITNQKAAFVDILLYFVDPESGAISHGIPGTGGSSFVAKEKNGPYMSDECFKMALTDAISVAAKSIGVAADIYFAKDRTKYSGSCEDDNAAPDKKKEEPEPYNEPEPLICDCCGRELTPYTGADGRIVSVKKHANRSLEKYKRLLCINCVLSLDQTEE